MILSLFVIPLPSSLPFARYHHRDTPYRTTMIPFHPGRTRAFPLHIPVTYTSLRCSLTSLSLYSVNRRFIDVLCRLFIPQYFGILLLWSFLHPPQSLSTHTHFPGPLEPGYPHASHPLCKRVCVLFHSRIPIARISMQRFTFMEHLMMFKVIK